ncbi:MAG: nicotinate (nicotinamide) nucleotide adenylyltransferase [Thermotogae bacterium]|nr:MAG: nicotinate (nicotinamide) nucleotide adenylyltransferase [Thermotogota bacterium]
MYGILGGSFNPPHNAHIVIATLSIEELDLEKLFVVPSYVPPHKSSADLAPFEKRFSWLRRIFSSIEKVEVVDVESKLPTPSYALRTVKWFKENVGKDLYFIVGEDALSYIETWHRYEDLIGETRIAVYPRYCGKPFEEHARKVLGKAYERILWLNLPIIQLSATQVRERARRGLPLTGMVPHLIEREVRRFFKEAGSGGL